MGTLQLSSHGLRHLTTPRPWIRACCSSFATASLASLYTEESVHGHPNTHKNNEKSSSYFPKRGQTLELVCESLAFKGKGLCKVTDTGFVVMCDRALPGERFIGRVTRKKGNYAEKESLGYEFELFKHIGRCK